VLLQVQVVLALLLRVLGQQVLGQQLEEGEGVLLLQVLGLQGLQAHRTDAAILLEMFSTVTASIVMQLLTL
jgi:hypothetical protein